MKGRILQLNTSISLKLKFGRVSMGRVLHLGPSFMWAELAWAELVLGRVVLHPLKKPESSWKNHGIL